VVALMTDPSIIFWTGFAVGWGCLSFILLVLVVIGQSNKDRP
jgi:hypothetical protein